MGWRLVFLFVCLFFCGFFVVVVVVLEGGGNSVQQKIVFTARFSLII